jgi:DNA modification methylase
MKDHPAPFPEKLVEILVQNTTDKNDIVLDPFIGSGTTAFVCKKLFRNYIGVELNPKYVEFANNRLASLLF